MPSRRPPRGAPSSGRRTETPLDDALRAGKLYGSYEDNLQIVMANTNSSAQAIIPELSSRNVLNLMLP
jgi:hypothetical protein